MCLVYQNFKYLLLIVLIKLIGWSRFARLVLSLRRQKNSFLNVDDLNKTETEPNDFKKLMSTRLINEQGETASCQSLKQNEITPTNIDDKIDDNKHVQTTDNNLKISENNYKLSKNSNNERNLNNQKNDEIDQSKERLFNKVFSENTLTFLENGELDLENFKLKRHNYKYSQLFKFKNKLIKGCSFASLSKTKNNSMAKVRLINKLVFFK